LKIFISENLRQDYYKHVKTIWPRLFEAYILAKEAHIELDLIREGVDLTSYKLIIIPSSLVLRTSSWYALKRYVEQNGTIYFSYGGSCIGSPNPLGPFFNEIFGVQLQDRIAPMPSERLMFSKDWMSLKGNKLEYPKTDGASCLEVKPNKGHVIAYDSHKNPAIIVNEQKGKGTAMLVSHPIEFYLSVLPDAYLSDKTFLIYEALKKTAKLSCPISCNNPFIEVGWMETDDKDEAVIILINHERVKIKTSILLNQVWQLTSFLNDKSFKGDTKEKKTLMRLSFSPSEVKVFNAIHQDT
jgi:endo-1,4-beta-mannosidase